MLRWLLLEITCLLLGTLARQPNVGWRGQVMCPLHSDCWPVTYSCEGFVSDLVCNPLLSQPGPPRAMRSGSYDYWSLVHPLSSLPLARLTSTPWTKVGYDGHGLAPLPWVLDGQLGTGRPQARAPVLGVRFSSAWCCAPCANCTPLHPTHAITSLGSSASHGSLSPAFCLLQCPPSVGPQRSRPMPTSAVPQVPPYLLGAGCRRLVNAGQGDTWVWVLCTASVSDPVNATAACPRSGMQSLCPAALISLPCYRWHFIGCARLGRLIGSGVASTSIGQCRMQPRPSLRAAWQVCFHRPCHQFSKGFKFWGPSPLRQPLASMARNRGRRGQGSGRRRRPRDAERERARPTRSERQNAANRERAMTLTSETSDEAMVPAQPLPKRFAGRPLTVFAQHLDGDSSPVTRFSASSSSRPALLPDGLVSPMDSAAGAGDATGDAAGASSLFEPQGLRQELPPDEFLAMASILGRSYADGSRSDLRGVASRWRTRASPAATSNAPGRRDLAHVETERERSRSRGQSTPPERGSPALRVGSSTRRSWPAGATPGNQFVTTASHSASALLATAEPASGSRDSVPVAAGDPDVMIVGGTSLLRPQPKLRSGLPTPVVTVDLTDSAASSQRATPLSNASQTERQRADTSITLIEDVICEEHTRAVAMLVAQGPPTTLRAADLPSNLEDELTWNQAWTLSIEGQALYHSVAASCLAPMGRSPVTRRR